MSDPAGRPAGLTRRRAGPEDVPQIAALFNAHGLAVAGTRRALLDAGGELRTARYIPDAAEQWLVQAADGSLVAHVWLVSRPPHVVIEMGLTLHPGQHAAAAGTALLDDIEARAGALVALALEGARVVAQTTVLADDAAVVALLRGRGFDLARQWVHFELALDEAPVVPTLPGVTIRPMDPRVDWPVVGAAMDAAFSDHWGEMGPDVRTLLEEDAPDEADDGEGDEADEDDPYSNSLGLCFVAEADGEVIGACLCNARTVEWPDTGKLGSLSVLRAYRRQGVGHALTATALAEFHRRGIRRIITDTDSASFTGANRLYPRFGFRPYRYEHVYEKELRPGLEWRLLSPEEMT